MITALNQFARQPTDQRFAGRLNAINIVESWQFIHQLLDKPTAWAHNEARVITPRIDRTFVCNVSRVYAEASRDCYKVGAIDIGEKLQHISARLVRVGPQAPNNNFLRDALMTMSRARTKQSEIFIREMFNADIDMDIHIRDDAGIDARVWGYWVQIKRFGTWTKKRGNVCFVLERNDRYLDDPPWDLGFVVEDDPYDCRAWRLTGWVSHTGWVRGRCMLHRLPIPAWGISSPHHPAVLFDQWNWSQHTGLSSRSDDLHPWLGRPRNPPRAWPPLMKTQQDG